jgi:hypothetical protein
VAGLRHFRVLLSCRPPILLPPVAPVEYLEAARSLAGDHNLGVTLAEFYLSNRPAGGVNLAQDDGCAPFCASRRPAGAPIAASPDLNGRWERIEVGFEHRLFYKLGAARASLFELHAIS